MNTVLEEAMALIKAFKAEIPHLVINTADHIDLIERYFKVDFGTVKRGRCTALYDSLFINQSGDVGLCWIGRIGNVREGSVKEMYYSRHFDEAREKAQKCEYPCMLGCLIRPGLPELIKLGLKKVMARG